MCMLFNWKEIRLYLILAVLIKLCTLGLVIYLQSNSQSAELASGWVFIHNDYSYFLLPVENYFSNGLYSYDGITAFGGRMPGYWAPYLMIRYLFSAVIGLQILIALQIVLAIIAAVVFGKLLESKLDSRKIGVIATAVYGLSAFLFPFDNQTVSESFSISTFTIFLYFLNRFLENRNSRLNNLLYAGFWLAWAIMLRPYLGLLIILVPTWLLFTNSSKGLIMNIKYALVFFIPFLIMEVAWIARNAVVFDKFIPLTTGVEQYGRTYSDGWQKSRLLIYKMGGEAAYFQPGLAHWMRREPNQPTIPKDLIYRVRSTAITHAEMQNLKQKYRSSLACKEDSCYYNIDAEVAEIAEVLLLKLKSNNPVQYYLLSPLQGLKRLIFTSGSSYLSIYKNLGIFYYLTKVIFVLLYYGVLCLGIIGLIYKFKTDPINRISIFMIASITGVVCVYSVIQEPRYFIHCYVMLLLFTFQFFHRLKNWQNIRLKRK